MFLFAPTPLAFGPFTSGWMLLWGLAALVPILLHLLNRRRRRTVAWAAMQFLAEAIQSQARRMRLWQLLLLLLRVLAIVLIALAVANPIFRGADDSDRQAREAQLHVLVVDTSFSMRAKINEDDVDGLRRWERSQQAVLAKLDAIDEGDGLLLVEMSDPPRPIIARTTFDPALARQSLSALEPTFGTADVEATLNLVATLIADAQRMDPVGGTPEVSIFSDLQRPTWQPIAMREPTLRWEPLGPSVLVDLLDVTTGFRADATESQPTNLAVTELHANPPHVFANQPALIEATVFASGDLPQTEQRVQLKVDGKLRDSRPVVFGASNRVTASFETTFAPGERVVTVDISSDILPIDNQRSLVLNVPQQLRVLCLGPPSRTRYLAAAINPGDQTWVQVTEAPVARVANVEQDVFDVIMLCDVESPSSRLIRWLTRSASRGTGILWWIGQAADAEAYGALDGADTARLLPIRLEVPATFDTYAVDPRSYEHPIAAPFEDFPQSGLLSTPIFRYWKVSLREETESLFGNPLTPSRSAAARGQGERSESRVALAVGAESDPLLLTFALPERRVAVFTSAPAAAATSGAGRTNEPWNALVAWPSFVPLVQETVRWLSAGRFERPTLSVGDTIQGVSDRQQAAVHRVQSIDGEDVSVTVRQQEDGRWRWSTRTLSRPGLYQLYFPDEEVQTVAVNLDATESDLDSVVGLSAQQGASEAVSTDEPKRVSRPDRLQGRWFRWLLLVALAALVAESLFSRTMAGWRR